MPRKLNKAKKPEMSFMKSQRQKLYQDRLKNQEQKREKASLEFKAAGQKFSRMPFSYYQTKGSRGRGYDYMQRTFREFLEITEGKRKPFEPYDAVPGTYKVNADGSTEYMLKPPKSPKKPRSKKEILGMIKRRGGHGKKAIIKNITEKNDVILKSGENYGSTSYQRRRDRVEQDKRKKSIEILNARRNTIRSLLSQGLIRGVHRGRWGTFNREGEFTPDQT